MIGSKVGNWLNGDLYSDRSEWLAKAQEMGADPNSKGIILLHLRIIAEGFDVPGLNTFIPMSLMSLIKAIQNIGRILRPFANKQMAIVAIPGFTLNRDNIERFRKLIESLEDEYGWDGADFVNDWMNPDVDNEDDKDPLPFEKRKKRERKELGDLLNGVKFRFWKERNNSKTIREAINNIII